MFFSNFLYASWKFFKNADEKSAKESQKKSEKLNCNPRYRGLQFNFSDFFGIIFQIFWNQNRIFVWRRQGKSQTDSQQKSHSSNELAHKQFLKRKNSSWQFLTKFRNFSETVFVLRQTLFFLRKCICVVAGSVARRGFAAPKRRVAHRLGLARIREYFRKFWWIFDGSRWCLCFAQWWICLGKRHRRVSVLSRTEPRAWLRESRGAVWKFWWIFGDPRWYFF